MCQGIALLDEALELARQELARETMDEYRSRLLEQARLQEQLSDIAARARNDVRQSLNHARREQRRIRGYHQAVGHALQ